MCQVLSGGEGWRQTPLEKKKKADLKGLFDSTGTKIHSQEFAATSESGRGWGCGVHDPISRECPVDLVCESHISYLDQCRQAKPALLFPGTVELGDGFHGAFTTDTSPPRPLQPYYLASKEDTFRPDCSDGILRKLFILLFTFLHLSWLALYKTSYSSSLSPVH